MPRRDGASGRYKLTRKRRKTLGNAGSVDASKQKSRAAKMRRGGKHQDRGN